MKMENVLNFLLVDCSYDTNYDRGARCQNNLY
jgi:hypothetical protein